jgi:hypothetical protein
MVGRMGMLGGGSRPKSRARGRIDMARTRGRSITRPRTEPRAKTIRPERALARCAGIGDAGPLDHDR